MRTDKTQANELLVRESMLQVIEDSAAKQLDEWRSRLQDRADEMKRAQAQITKAQQLPLGSRERATEIARILESCAHSVMWLIPNMGIDYGVRTAGEIQIHQRELEAAAARVEPEQA